MHKGRLGRKCNITMYHFKKGNMFRMGEMEKKTMGKGGNVLRYMGFPQITQL